MRKYREPFRHYICPNCTTIYEVLPGDLNFTMPYCLKCDSPLLKTKYRR